MAQYFEEAKIFADLIKDKNRLKSQVAGASDEAIQIRKDDSGKITIKDWDVEIRTRNVGHAFILGNDVNGILGVTSGVDSKQVTLGLSGKKNHVLVQKRRWLFNTDVLLRRRQTTSSITSSGADITLSVD